MKILIRNELLFCLIPVENKLHFALSKNEKRCFESTVTYASKIVDKRWIGSSLTCDYPQQE